MAAVMIGVNPHKGSHTAVAIGAAEEPLGELRVRASAAQAGRLVAWAAAWPERTWAVEGAGVPPPASRPRPCGVAFGQS
jgi:transposase